MLQVVVQKYARQIEEKDPPVFGEVPKVNEKSQVSQLENTR